MVTVFTFLHAALVMNIIGTFFSKMDDDLRIACKHDGLGGEGGGGDYLGQLECLDSLEFNYYGLLP